MTLTRSGIDRHSGVGPDSSATVTISTIPQPPSESHITLYSEIRVASLCTNPESFHPFYLRELTFSRSKWRERLSLPGVTTLYVAESDGPIANGGDESQPFLELSTPLADSKGKSKPWVGTLTVLSPDFLTSTIGMAEIPKPVTRLNSGEIDVWHLAGMWVRPEWRGRGVGKILMQKALEVVKSSQSSNNTTSDLKGDRDTLIVLGVSAKNTTAIHLYSLVGFHKMPFLSSESERREMDGGFLMEYAIKNSFRP